ncbi:MAG TPA: hypothetical protein PKE16_19830 [Hyphomicrobium sp.]|nr:hypothetical protein [Hyphomicrobium sp.]
MIATTLVFGWVVTVFVAWAIGLYSIHKSQYFGRRASAHLCKAEQNYYIVQLGLLPGQSRSVKDSVRSLLKGQGLEDHEQALHYARISVMAMFVFFLAFLFFGCAIFIATRLGLISWH